MIRILRSDGTIIEVPRALSAEVKGKEVVCQDSKGVIVARYPSATVTLFGLHLPEDGAEFAESTLDTAAG